MCFNSVDVIPLPLAGDSCRTTAYAPVALIYVHSARKGIINNQ